jgi:hypothetical protein
MIVWLLAMAASSLLTFISSALYFVAVGLLTAGLLAICHAKGEPARWRWGEDSKLRGENSTLTCPACRKSFPASAKFCPHCGREGTREIGEGEQPGQ